MWLAFLPLIASAATPRELRQLGRACEQGQADACLQLSERLGDTAESQAVAARACALGSGPGCHREGLLAEARLPARPIPAQALDAFVAYERGCAASSEEACRASSRTAHAWADLLHLSEERQLALHEAACEVGEADACGRAAVLRALAGPVRRPTRRESGSSGLHPLVAARRTAILACYDGVKHTRIAVYRSVVRIAVHGAARGVRVFDAGRHAACLAGVFEQARVPAGPGLVVLTLPLDVQLGPEERTILEPSAPPRPHDPTARPQILAALDAAPVQPCFQDEAVRTHTPAGTMRVRFTIAPDGTPRDVTAHAAALPAPQVEACVLEVIRALRFPPPRDSTIIRVEHDIQFRPW